MNRLVKQPTCSANCKALFISALKTVSPNHSDCAGRENKSVFRKSIASRPDPSLVSLYLSQKIFTEKQFLFSIKQ